MAGFAIAVGLSGCAYVTRSDVAAPGATQVPGNDFGEGLSRDGRFAVITAFTPLVSSDTNGVADIYVRDHRDGTTERVSVTPGGGDPNGRSVVPSISGDGRYVLFQSDATNLLASGPTPAGTNLFLRDRTTHTTTMLNLADDGHAPDAPIDGPRLSGNGRVVMFRSAATNIVPGGTAGQADVYVRDLDTSTTERIDVASNGVVADQDSFGDGISDDGTIVGFETTASNLGSNPSGINNVYVRNRANHTTARVSVATNGGAPDASTGGGGALDLVSGTGRYVVFSSLADNLTVGDTPGTADVFVRDLTTGTTSRAVTDAVTVQPIALLPWGISDDGRFVLAVGLRTGINDQHAYVMDRTAHRLSLVGTGAAQIAPAKGSQAGTISRDGAYVLFSTDDPTLVRPQDAAGDGFGAFLRSTVIPGLSTAAPATAPAGSTLTVHLTGSYLFSGGSVSFGPGVTVTNVAPVDEQHVDVTIRVAADATPGSRTIRFQNPGTGAGPGTGGFTDLVAGFAVS